MKKSVLLFGLAATISAVVYFSYGCKDKDKFAPKLYLTGETEIVTELSQPFKEPGITAEDNNDGDLTSKIVIGHNIPKRWSSVAGDSLTSKTSDNEPYTINYSVTDGAGNQKSATRKVWVRNYAYPYAIKYILSRKKVTESTVSTDSVGCQYAKYYYRRVEPKITLKADNDTNKQMTLYVGGEIQAKLIGTITVNNHIKIPQQTVYGVRGYVRKPDTNFVSTVPIKYRITGLSQTSNDFSASLISDTTTGKKKIILKYTIEKYDTVFNLQWVPASPLEIKWSDVIEYSDTLLQSW